MLAALGSKNLLVACSLLLIACGDDSQTSGGGGEGGASNPGIGGGAGEGGTAPATIEFLVNERPHDPTSQEQATTKARYTDPVRVVASGLVPGSSVRFDTLSGQATSFALFEVPEDGVVDFARDAPVEGSWSGADADGFLWSLDEMAGLNITVTVSSESGDPIVEGELERAPFAEGTVAEIVEVGTLVGTFYRPVGDGPFPAVLTFGGSEGGRGSGEFNAAYLATLGYAALGVAYFDEPGLPAVLTDVPLEILEADLAWLRARPEVDADRIGVWGASRGGELALLLAARDPGLAAAIAEVPSGYVWGSASDFNRAAWTVAGAELPYVPSLGEGYEIFDDELGSHLVSTPAFHADIEAASPTELESARIRVEDASAAIMFIAGADDQLWPSCALSEVSMDVLSSTGHADAVGDELLCYESAGHWIGLPGSSTMNSQRYFDGGYWIELGGTPAGAAAAQRDSNTRMRAFLERTLGTP
jgi:acetyl esterase/lipase